MEPELIRRTAVQALRMDTVINYTV